jgi:hypothetical protein
MRDALLKLASGVAGGVALGLFLSLPLVVLIAWVHRRKKRYKAEREDPFTDLPLRPPGESLRLRIDELADEQMSTFLIALLAPVLSLVLITGLPAQYRLHGLGAAFIVISVISYKVGQDVIEGLRNLWNHKLAFTGERVVGEELNQLLADGCHVFHDLPFESFNIDHVIVGPSGVYAVETKTRRKPKENGKKAGHKVEFDGASLTFEKIGRDVKAAAQAKANAQSLSKWLSGETGEKVFARGIVTIPGWWVDDSTEHPVWVLNPKRIQVFVSRPTESPLPSKLVNQIVYKLTERCRLKKE